MRPNSLEAIGATFTADETQLWADLQCESTKNPPGFLIFFPNGWKFLV